MDNIRVELLHHTPIEVALKAIQKPYANQGKCDINLLKKVCLNDKLNERHGSVLEHIYLNWDILGTSRLELQEHARHRIASPTVESTRFTLDKLITEVNETDNIDEIQLEKYFVYPYIEDKHDWDADFEKIDDFYHDLDCINKQNIENLSDLYGTYYTKKIDNDILKYILPENFRVNMTWSINLRSFINFLKLRLDKSAHLEIRHVANLMWKEIEKNSPDLKLLLEDGVNTY